MGYATEALAKYIRSIGVRPSFISDKTGINRGVLYASLNGRRELRADELLAICALLKKNPFDFYNQSA